VFGVEYPALPVSVERVTEWRRVSTAWRPWYCACSAYNRRCVCSGFRETEIVSTRTADSRGFALL